MPKTTKQPFRADIRAKLVEVASKGELVSYLDLGAGRAMIGRYLVRIAREEALAGRPPLTSVVVRKNTGRLGEGFRKAMQHADIGFAKAGETELEVWKRAVSETRAYWRPKLSDEI